MVTLMVLVCSLCEVGACVYIYICARMEVGESEKARCEKLDEQR